MNTMYNEINAILQVAQNSSSLADFLKIVTSEDFIKKNIKANPMLLRKGRIEVFYTHYEVITQEASHSILNKILDIGYEEPQISLEDARKSYADFMKIEEKILMLLSEDESAFYFLHCKKDFCWKTSVSKRESGLFHALDRLSEKEIELYNKWLMQQTV